MDEQFWKDVWRSDKRRFHQGVVNAQLLKYFVQLGSVPGQRILVPLCGKAVDLVWLARQGLEVHGIEIREEPIKEFFDEHGKIKNLRISCEDFLMLNGSQAYDFVYDRAALIALPSEMRKSYAKVVTDALKSGGKYLLLSLEHNESSGPPFSVPAKEITDLYSKSFSIKTLENDAYLLTKF